MQMNKNLTASAMAKDVVNVVLCQVPTLSEEQRMVLIRQITARIAEWLDDA